MKYLKKFENVSSKSEIEGTELVVSVNGYKLYLIKSREGVTNLYVDEDASWFDSYTNSAYMYCIIKGGKYIYTFYVDYKDYEVHEIEDAALPNFSPQLSDVKKSDTFAYELMVKTAKSYDLSKVMGQINGKYEPIKEFWEWSKNSYGMDKHRVDSQTAMTAMNTQHGYSEEGQWAQTQDGDVYIEEIVDGVYRGFNRDGDPMTGSIKDIIRTLMKKEVIK
jgi:hypothetical protein